MSTKIHYLVKTSKEQAELEGKIAILSQHFLFNTHPLGEDEVMNSNIIVRKRNCGGIEQYVVFPFPYFELSLMRTQTDKTDTVLKVQRVGGDYSSMVIGDDVYIVYPHFTLE